MGELIMIILKVFFGGQQIQYRYNCNVSVGVVILGALTTRKSLVSEPAWKISESREMKYCNNV